MPPVIEFDAVSKGYRLGTGHTSLREAVPQLAHRLFGRNGAAANQLFWALDNVSFSVEQGEVLGIIGHNGAGKSTTLKLLSKVTYPDSGRIHTRGRMAALIELGAGFHPDLSGRENIYLNGSILGLKRREIDAQFGNIVEFAGLQQFIDTPIKRYSSGMYVRLAFAVAAHVKADVLLVDEVLSVGDMAFQQKSLAKMNELRDSGATIIFISHNLWSVSKFCQRVLLLEGGKIVAQGQPNDVINAYSTRQRAELLAKATQNHDASAQWGGTVIPRIDLMDEAGQPTTNFEPDTRLRVRINYVAPAHIETPVFNIQIRRADGLSCCMIDDWNEGESALCPIQGAGLKEALIGPLPLVPDYYTIEAHISDRHQSIVYASSTRESFQINGRFLDHEVVGVFRPNARWLTE